VINLVIAGGQSAKSLRISGLVAAPETLGIISIIILVGRDPQEAVMPIFCVNVESHDYARRVDAQGCGALVKACARRAQH
jgi:hypothetical protein